MTDRNFLPSFVEGLCDSYGEEAVAESMDRTRSHMGPMLEMLGITWEDLFAPVDTEKKGDD